MHELERFLEDQRNSATRQKDTIGKKLLKLTNLVAEERKVLTKLSQKYKLEKNLETMRRSGKPFFWVDIAKLRSLKTFCENQKDPDIRAKAFDALKEYESIIDQYNNSSKHKITDIFPQKEPKQPKKST
mgnify:FL=1